MMMSPHCRIGRKSLFSQKGFTLLESLIAILLTAIGMLGLAFLIAFAIQRTQSSQQIGTATDLAQDALDMMRANRLEAYRMTGLNQTGASACAVAESNDLTPKQRRQRWDCRLFRDLPGASANITYTNGLARVQITWNRDRFEEGDDAKGVLSFESKL